MRVVPLRCERNINRYKLQDTRIQDTNKFQLVKFETPNEIPRLTLFARDDGGMGGFE